MHDRSTSELLGALFRALRRRKWLALSVAAVCTLAATASSLADDPSYRSVAEVLLRPSSTEAIIGPSTAGEVDDNRDLLTELQVITSEPIRTAVADQLGAAPEVTVTAAGGANVVQITATAGNPHQAATIANSYADAYVEYRHAEATDDLRRAIEDVTKQSGDVSRRIAELDARIGAAAGSPQAGTLAQERERLVDRRSLFELTSEQLTVELGLATGGARVISTATPPGEPFAPQPMRTALGGLAAGVLLGVGVALVRDHFDDSLTDPEHVTRVTGALPHLGLIPVERKRRSQDGPLVRFEDPTSLTAEAFRALRNTVLHTSTSTGARVFAVTSPGPEEGKTYVAANLGVALAGVGTEVVVASCDLRRPTLHERFGIDGTIGISSVIAGEVPLSEALQQVEGLPTLSVLPSGPATPAPAELLASSRGVETLDALRHRADVVILDCAPLLPVADATQIADHVDAYLLVAALGKVRGRQLRRALDVLGGVDGHIGGVVVNRVDLGDAESYYASSYYRTGFPSHPDDTLRGRIKAWGAAPWGAPVRTPSGSASR